MGTTKTTQMESKTFFTVFFITIVKRALQYTIFDQKINVTYFCLGFTLKFAPFLFMCTTKTPQIDDPALKKKNPSPSSRGHPRTPEFSGKNLKF